jgi:hypothetical protein
MLFLIITSLIKRYKVMKKSMAVILMALVSWNVHIASAQKPGVVLSNEKGWQKIGETEASFKSQDESIAVIGADEFQAIKLKVDNAPLQIDRLQVFYESGDMQEIDVQKNLQPGEETSVYKLDNPTRDIQKVAFTYHTVSNAKGDKADVELYGLKSGNEPSDSYRHDADKTRDDIKRESSQAERDIERGADNTKKDVNRAADKTGNAISETAGKVAADIDDPKLDTKVGPDGETIFVGDDSRYYYVNDKGKRVYVTWSQLKDKPESER